MQDTHTHRSTSVLIGANSVDLQLWKMAEDASSLITICRSTIQILRSDGCCVRDGEMVAVSSSELQIVHLTNHKYSLCILQDTEEHLEDLDFTG